MCAVMTRHEGLLGVWGTGGRRPGGTGWAHAAGGKGRLNFLYS